MQAAACLALAWLGMLAASPLHDKYPHPHDLVSTYSINADATRFGVYYGSMAHHFVWNETHASYGIAHFMYRAVRISPSELQINGHVYWQDTGGPEKALWMHIVLPPQWLHKTALQVQMYSAANKTAKDVVVNVHTPEFNFGSLGFTATGPLTGAEDLRLRLEYDGQLWPQYIPIAPAVHYAQHQSTLGEYMGSRDNAFSRGNMLVKMLSMHLWWHSRMGFDGALLYTDLAHYIEVAQHDQVQGWVQAGRLLPMAFDYVSKFQGYNYVTQPMQTTHAILSMKWRNVWLSTSDLDEFFMSDTPGMDVGQYLASMRQQNGPNVAQVCGHVQRKGVSAYAAQVLVQPETMKCDSCGERGDIHAWMAGTPFVEMMARYTKRYGFFQHYYNFPKGLVDPDASWFWGVHHGVVEPWIGNEQPLQVRGSRACFLGHFNDLNRDRHHQDVNETVGDMRWMWPVQPPVTT